MYVSQTKAVLFSCPSTLALTFTLNAKGLNLEDNLF